MLSYDSAQKWIKAFTQTSASSIHQISTITTVSSSLCCAHNDIVNPDPKHERIYRKIHDSERTALQMSTKLANTCIFFTCTSNCNWICCFLVRYGISGCGILFSSSFSLLLLSVSKQIINPQRKWIHSTPSILHMQQVAQHYQSCLVS